MNNKINLKIIPDSSFLLGGVTVNPAYNMATALDEGLPYLTATAIKGAIRMEFDAFTGGIGKVDVCEPDSDFRGCGKCISCRLFGGTKLEGKLRFNVALLENPENTLPKETRHEILKKGRREGVAISRVLGKAKDQSYYSTLTFPNLTGIADIVFKTDIDIREKLDDEEIQYLEVFLAFLEKTGIFMGSRKSTGLGHFKISGNLPDGFTKPMPVDTSQKQLKMFRFTLRTLEPLVVGDLTNRYIVNTLPYIPSSTMGGSIGFGMRQYGIDDTIINEVFLKKKTLSPFNFYLKEPFPIPTSFRAKKGEKEENKQKDILLEDYVIDYAINREGGFEAVKELFQTLYRSNLRPVPFCPQPITTYNTKLAIDRELQKGRERMLFSMELIPKYTRFYGLVIGEGWIADALGKKEILIGGKKTRGFGRTEIADITEIDVNELLNPDSSVDSLLRETARKYGIVLPAKSHFFTLDLLTDFPVENGKKFKDVLEKELFAGMNMEIKKAFPHVVLRGGYDYKEKREKPLREKISAGSTFLVSVPAGREGIFREKMTRMIEESVNYKWDETPLFMVNNPKHKKMWR